MRKLTVYFLLSLFCLSCLISSITIAQSLFGFGSQKKSSAQTVPAEKTKAQTPDEFKNTVKMKDQKTKQGLEDQLKQDLSKKSLKNVTPPAATSSPAVVVPTSSPASLNITKTPPGVPPMGTPVTVTPTTPTVVQSQPSPPAVTTAPPPPPASTVMTAPTTGSQGSGVYTGFQGGQNTQTPKQDQQSGGWNIKY